MAENHPVGFQWVIEGRERGAKVIHVDPRFSRTSAMADIWAPLRAGSDILFLGGLIHYVLENHKEFRDYLIHYTDASAILTEDFKDTEDLDGLFSGWDAREKKYNPHTWLCEGHSEREKEPSLEGLHSVLAGGHGKERGGKAADLRRCERDLTLEHPRCVYQILKNHFSRYTPEMVERYCGVPKELFLKLAETYCSASGPERLVSYATQWAGRSIRAGCK